MECICLDSLWQKGSFCRDFSIDAVSAGQKKPGAGSPLVCVEVCVENYKAILLKLFAVPYSAPNVLQRADISSLTLCTKTMQLFLFFILSFPQSGKANGWQFIRRGTIICTIKDRAGVLTKGATVLGFAVGAETAFIERTVQDSYRNKFLNFNLLEHCSAGHYL